MKRKYHNRVVQLTKILIQLQIVFVSWNYEVYGE